MGDTTFDDITLSRGVTTASSEFHLWMLAARQGKEYRSDIKIKQFHRKNISSQNDFSALKPSRVIKCFEALPVTSKPGSDLESTNSDISVQEITIGMEYFEVTNSNT